MEEWYPLPLPDIFDYFGSEGCTIRLLLNLDEGTLNAYKDDHSVGILLKSGLSGEYCWLVSIPSLKSICKVNIKRSNWA